MAEMTLKVRLLLESDGKILLLKQTSRQGGKYSLVGGFVERGETPIEALIRECKEEAGIDLLPVDLHLIHTLHKSKGRERRITLYFRATHFVGKARSMEPRKFQDAVWFPLKKLPSNLSSTTEHVLLQYKSGNKYSEYVL
ncbi:MAG: NUDIX domain-containing protein [Saprospiraceae bacterium]|jgi:8-oxo-dGTP diphosphatase